MIRLQSSRVESEGVAPPSPVQLHLHLVTPCGAGSGEHHWLKRAGGGLFPRKKVVLPLEG